MTTIVLEWAGYSAASILPDAAEDTTQIAAVIGPRGPTGPTGPTGRGITVSATAPADPDENDLWVDIS